MNTLLSRRGFLASSAGLTVLAAAASADTPASTASQPQSTTDTPNGVGPTFPSTDPAKAHEIVLVCHARIDRVRELLEEDRALALAAWDWGYGDWESAIGAASHMGRKDIAQLLMDHGARPTLFTFAMLDQIDVVRAYCQANPGIQKLPGPHGITLMGHARNGNATRVQDYLTQLGGADQTAPSLDTTDEQIEPLLGTYRFGEGETETLTVERSRSGALGIRREGASFRRLNRTADHTFSPGGAPHITIRFAVSDAAPSAQAPALNIHRGEFILTATRT